MRLRIKNFNWLAGRPVVILNENAAKKLNVHVDDRILISNSKKIYAVVDIFNKIVKDSEIGLSNEISSLLEARDRSFVDVSPSQISLASQLIRKKLMGEKLSGKEFNTLISEIVHNNLTEAELAFFTAAEKAQGMTLKETVELTKAMVKNGKTLKFNKKIVADKHSIGGIAGNRTTPIVVSICAAAGLTIPKTSSRAITSASGTADVVETIANVEFSAKRLKEIVEKTNACLAWGGSLGLAPSDDKIIYVERILNLDIEPQLLASIISKKISAGSKYILIDIPYGKSAKVKDKKQAENLGKKFMRIAKYFHIRVKAVYTDGKQPIGRGIGPVLEMMDVLKVLKNEKDAPEDLRKKSLYLSAELMKLCRIKNPEKLAEEILNSGKALEKFKEIINEQNSKNNFDEKVKSLKLARFSRTILSKKTGKITSIDNKKINSLCRILGTPETVSAGVFLHSHLEKIRKGEKLMTLYSESRVKLNDAGRYIKDSKPIIIKQ